MVSRALFIGRFQPFHRGHLTMVKRILERQDEILIGIGSAQYSHTGENPFTAGERYEMVQRTLDAEGLHNYHVIPIPDTHVHSVWVGHVLSLVPRFDVVYSNSPLVIRLLKEKGVKVVELPLHEKGRYSGREIRRKIFKDEPWRDLVPPAVATYIEEIEGVERIKETFHYSTPYGTRENEASP